MEEHLNRTLLDNFDMTSDSHSNSKNHEVHSVLQSIHARDQEFIDHSLLTPEYMTNMPNGFVIDIMENQRNDNNTHSHIYNGHNDTYSNEFQFQNAILQLVNNKQNLVRSTESQVLVTKNENNESDEDKINIDTGFMAIDDGILTSDGQFRIFQPPITQHSDHHNMSVHLNTTPITFTQIKRTCKQKLPIYTDDRTKIQYSNLGSLEVSIKNDITHQEIHQIHNETGNFSNQYFQQQSLSKKTLPHKKRITKKLKIHKTNSTMIYQDDLDDCGDEDSIVINSNPFSCQLCEHMSESQIEFFTHLKGHYEPSIDGMSDKNHIEEFTRSPSVTLMNDNSQYGNIMQKREKNAEIVVGEQFQEVEIDFDNFEGRNGLNNSPIYQTSNEKKPEITSIKQEDILTEAQKINEIIKNKRGDLEDSYNREFEKTETQILLQANSNLQTKVMSEVEFSDTEDMLEGIRGVVDKVQECVDDSDEMEMISNSSKAPWFANNSLSGSIYKEAILNNNISLQEDSKEIIKSQPSSLITHYSNNNSKPRYLKGINDENSVSSNSPKRGRPKGSGKKTKKFEPSEEDVASNENSTKIYFCEKCNKHFNSYNALKYHDLSHTGERPHQCSDCGKSFFAQSALKAHLRVHSGDKPYECDVCHRKFRQWGDLKYHTISIHSNEKNYQCEFCGKAFSRKYSLVIHRRIHTSEKNYKCEFCSKTFRASSYLQNHRKIHTGEKPYECNVCGKKFRVCGDLRRHQKTHERSKKRLAHISKAKLDKTDLL